MNHIQEAIRQVRVGPGLTFRELTVFPLHGRGRRAGGGGRDRAPRGVSNGMDSSSPTHRHLGARLVLLIH